ncbi:MAG TPA: DUF3105 domain-containing protein [Nitriliruptorales bacterium]
MAEQERPTKKARRAASREERKRKEEEARRKARRDSRLTGLATLAGLAVVGWVIWLAFAGGPETVASQTISVADAEAARTAAGCEVVDENAALDATHYEPATAPATSIMYPTTRPPIGGPHFTQFNNAVSAADNQLDERSTTHNLEHGAVIAWYDPSQVDDVGAIGSWAESLNASGFRITNIGQYVGASIFSSPFTDPGISSGKAVAFRAWGIGMDCDAWDETAANSFVIDNFGTHGSSAERALAPFPEGTLGYSDAEVGDNTEAPTGNRTDTPTDMQPDETGSATETGSPAPSPSP